MSSKQQMADMHRGHLEKNRLYIGGLDGESDVYQTCIGHVAVSTVADIEKPGPNEDSAAIVPVNGDGLVLMVADGVGGLPAAKRASNLAVQTICDYLSNADEEETRLRTAILDGIEAANQALLELGTGSATTLALVETRQDYVRSYHVGDSSIWLCGQRGRLKLQTTPHSPIGFAVESGLLDESDALAHEELNLISNAIGTTDMRIEISSELPLAARDTVLIASDGLFDNLLETEIIDTIRKGPLSAAIQSLTELAAARMREEHDDAPSKPDDFTAVLFRPDGKATSTRTGSS